MARGSCVLRYEGAGIERPIRTWHDLRHTALTHDAAAAADAFELVQEAFADCCCHCRKSTIIPFPLAGSAAPLR